MENSDNSCCPNNTFVANIVCESEVNRFEKDKGHRPVFSRKEEDVEPLATTMKLAYVKPEHGPQQATIGRKRALLLRQFRGEAVDEITRESEKPPPVEEYCTTYDRNYHIPDFRTENKSFEERTELHDKYPLYKSNAITFYGWSYENNPSGFQVGFTKAIDKAQPFKRNSNFTKPIEECYESNLQ